MKRATFDYYTLRRTNGGLWLNQDFHYNTIEDAVRAKEKIEYDKWGEYAVICHVEVYKYFDNDGFVKEERIISRLDDDLEYTE